LREKGGSMNLGAMNLGVFRDYVDW
jgi:hypothetical protein